MAYAHWKNNRHNDAAVFELFFRKNPFRGEYTIFCGLDECIKFVSNFSFSSEEIEYLKSTPALSRCDEGFWKYLQELDCSQVKLYAMREGTVAFPRVPLLVIEAPLGVGQLLETTLLTLVNYPSLIATNAARMVLAASRRSRGDQSSSTTLYPQQRKDPKCVEFGLRRAQGPDGGFSASKYSAVGGFVATSNVQAGHLLGLAVAGTHAHAFVQAYRSLDEVKDLTCPMEHEGDDVKLLPRVLEYRQRLGVAYQATNDGELAAFIAYAAAFPASFLCLIDTYDTLRSGLLNFVLVALVLDDCGYKAKGVRLDSGDLAYYSLECAKVFASQDRAFFQDVDIVASNDINENVLHSLKEQGHAITLFGIGTNLVTCQAQPALGCVYKLVQINGVPRMKLSQDIAKVLIPGLKNAFRLYGADGWPLLDVMVGKEEEAVPQAGQRFLCRHPFDERKRAYVTPTRVAPLHSLVFDYGKVEEMPSLTETKQYVQEQLQSLRPDILRYANPTPYKVSVSDALYTFLHNLWQSETPVAELE